MGHFDEKWFNLTENWPILANFLGIRIVRIFGQKYSRLEYLKIFEQFEQE